MNNIRDSIRYSNQIGTQAAALNNRRTGFAKYIVDSLGFYGMVEIGNLRHSLDQKLPFLPHRNDLCKSWKDEK